MTGQHITPMLLLHEDGSTRLLESLDPLGTARSLLGDQVSVYSCNNPGALEPRDYVLVIDDFGDAKGLPLNRKAWALYGRSPIYGPALWYRDDHEPIPPELLAAVTSGEFLTFELHDAMDAWLNARHGHRR